MSLLERIFESKRQELSKAKRRMPERTLERYALDTPMGPDFVTALTDTNYPPPRLIAEIKGRSPSKGVLRAHFDPPGLAQIYAQSGARAVSVLTDGPFFGGSLDDLGSVAKLKLGLPLLRKDFIFDHYQLLEARAHGASAVLLIVAKLSIERLSALIQGAADLALTPLVEVHSEAELETALLIGAQVIGINNRNLHNFTVNLETTLRLRRRIPPSITVVSESGIHTWDEVRRLAAAQVDAILVGEALMSADDPGAKVRELTGQRYPSTEENLK